jgi:hypothetical protein
MYEAPMANENFAILILSIRLQAFFVSKSSFVSGPQTNKTISGAIEGAI